MGLTSLRYHVAAQAQTQFHSIRGFDNPNFLSSRWEKEAIKVLSDFSDVAQLVSD
jgi:hypothetical protein